MPRRQTVFLIKQTLTSASLNGVFSAVAVFLVFRNKATVPLANNLSLIKDSLFQTFMATLMSILPPSLLTAKWMLSRPNLVTRKRSTARILIRALLIALAACLICFLVLPFALRRLRGSSLSFRDLLLFKCLYGMAIGIAVTPIAVGAVLRGHRKSVTTAARVEQR